MLLVILNDGLRASGTFASLLGSLRRFQRLLATTKNGCQRLLALLEISWESKSFQRLLATKNGPYDSKTVQKHPTISRTV